MPVNDLDLLIGAARAAGEVAKSYVGTPLNVQHKAGNAGPVTAADYAVNRLLEEKLRNARGDFGWLSEESEDGADRLGKDRVFIVDPIDGTRSFIEGQDTWAHSLAIAENGEVTEAVVYLPVLDRLYAAKRGEGATLNGAPIHRSAATVLDDADVLATKPNMDPSYWSGPVPGFRRHHRPSLAYRMSLVAQGRFDMMFTLRPSWEWDIAAGALILTEAGATVSDQAGKPLIFNNAHPQTNGVVAGGPELHAAVLARLKPQLTLPEA